MNSNHDYIDVDDTDVTVYVGDKIEMLVTDYFTLKKVTNIIIMLPTF